ncbi:MAG: benzoate-CoA ligase family protein [Burkholderiales bacterium]
MKKRACIIGAGPAGLLFSLLFRRRHPDWRVEVIEQNARNVTFGFGVVFSRGALEFLQRDAPDLHDLLASRMESWPMQRIVHRDSVVDIDGNGFSSIARLELNAMLQGLCEAAGVVLHFDRRIESPAAWEGADLVVGADGVNSVVRSAFVERFQPRLQWLTNKFAWYGTGKAFDCLTLTFRANEHGGWVAHHYRYSPAMSTFLIECDAATWYRAGLDQAGDEGSRRYCEKLFAKDLDGKPVVSNKSVWRNFPVLSNRYWTAGNVVLIGDALRTAHFSIGSGTRLALEDAIALDRAFAQGADDVPGALANFERARRPVVEKIVSAANASSFWYERMADKMALEPWQLAYDYMTRSGRMDDERIATLAPNFMHAVRGARRAAPDALEGSRLHDPFDRTSAAATELGLQVPEQYNCARILFDNLAAGRGGKAALLCEDRKVTYGELCVMAARCGNGLASLGLARGVRVLMLMPDTVEYVAAIFGALRAGFVPVLLNTLSPAELVAFYAQDSGAEVAVVHAQFAASLSHPDLRRSRLRHVVRVGSTTLPSPSGARAHLKRSRRAGDEGSSGAVMNWPDPALAGHSTWDELLASQPDTLAEAATHRDDMAFWMYSSGSTGRPKGVVHLHHDAPYTHAAYGEGVLGIQASDIVFSPPKIFFAYGFGNSLTFPFSVGAATVLLPGRPEPEAVYAAIERHRPTLLFGLPTLYNAMIAHPGSEQRDLSSLRLCLSAAEVLVGELFEEWKRRYGLSIVEGLGSTEVLHICLSNAVDRQKSGASGMRVPGYEVRLTDPDARMVEGEGSGVLWVRGDSQAPCYWNRLDKTAETMREGWIYTGDRFRRDADGFYFFEGRVDDLIKVSGQWIHPLEVERCLAEHPSVQECAVLGMEEENRLMTLAAFVVLKPGAARPDAATTRQLQDFVKSRLTPYKYPRRVQYLTALPKTGTDKIDRAKLKRHALPGRN